MPARGKKVQHLRGEPAVSTFLDRDESLVLPGQIPHNFLVERLREPPISHRRGHPVFRKHVDCRQRLHYPRTETAPTPAPPALAASRGVQGCRAPRVPGFVPPAGRAATTPGALPDPLRRGSALREPHGRVRAPCGPFLAKPRTAKSAD